MEFRAFTVRLPTDVRYSTVIDSRYRVVVAADEFLLHARLGRDLAESTTRAYVTALGLFLTCVGRSVRWMASSNPATLVSARAGSPAKSITSARRGWSRVGGATLGWWADRQSGETRLGEDLGDTGAVERGGGIGQDLGDLLRGVPSAAQLDHTPSGGVLGWRPPPGLSRAHAV